MRNQDLLLSFLWKPLLPIVCGSHTIPGLNRTQKTVYMPILGKRCQVGNAYNDLPLVQSRKSRVHP